MDDIEGLIPCPGCGARFPASDGPTHRYLGASPGCWATYCAVLAEEALEPYPAAVSRLLVDAYAAQHPGTPSRQSIGSVAGHLIVLYRVLEQGYPAGQATAIIRAALDQRAAFVWLDPPPPGPLTILDVQAALGGPEYAARLGQWVRSVWDAWVPHHETIRRWAALAPHDAARWSGRQGG